MFLEFGMETELAGVYEFPDKSSKSIPKEYKDIPTRINSHGLPRKTVRGCMPFFDAMTLGVIVPMPYDIAISSRDNGAQLEVFAPDINNSDYGLDGDQAATAIPQESIGGMSPYPIIKLETPYWIRSSKKVSCLMLPVINRFSSISVVSGLVDSDRFDTKLKFFLYWTGPDGDFVIKAGTPIAQIIPIHRKKYRIIKKYISKKDVNQRNSYQKRSRIDAGAYRRLWRESRNN